jgi:hypothetical protein
MLTGYDPVAAGLVASLARPGGNLTGVTSLTAEVGPKRVELLHGWLGRRDSNLCILDCNSPERHLAVTLRFLLPGQRRMVTRR